MDCLPDLCFMCLNYKGSENYTIIEDASDEIVEQVQFVLPEIATLEPRLPLLICSTCQQRLDNFHSFKKICLENNSRYNDHIKDPLGSSKGEFPQFEIQINDKLLNNTKEAGNIDSSTENLIYIKEEYSISDDSTDELYEQIAENETDCNNEQNCADQLIKYKIQSSEQEVTNNTDFKCSVCNEIFAKKSELRNHMMSYCNVKEKKCLLCDKLFTSVWTLRRHMTIHTSIQDYKCTICNKVCAQASDLKRHMTYHKGLKDNTYIEKRKCSICGKMFQRPFSLRRHMLVHTTVKDHKCLICNKMFKYPVSYRRHMMLHKTMKDYKCSTCNKMFATKQYLQYHLTTHVNQRMPENETKS